MSKPEVNQIVKFIICPKCCPKIPSFESIPSIESNKKSTLKSLALPEQSTHQKKVNIIENNKKNKKLTTLPKLQTTSSIQSNKILNKNTTTSAFKSSIGKISTSKNTTTAASILKPKSNNNKGNCWQAPSRPHYHIPHNCSTQQQQPILTLPELAQTTKHKCFACNICPVYPTTLHHHYHHQHPAADNHCVSPLKLCHRCKCYFCRKIPLKPLPSPIPKFICSRLHSSNQQHQQHQQQSNKIATPKQKLVKGRNNLIPPVTKSKTIIEIRL